MYESFNHDGPIEVSQADFDIYQTIFDGKTRTDNPSNKLSFDNLVEIWLDERHSDGVRRLAIRDAIRQPFGHGSRSNMFAYYQIDMNLGRLNNILFESGDKRAYLDLSYRPKLLDEIIGEFLYTLEHNRSSDLFRDQNSVDRLISHLIKLTDEPTGRRMTPYHSTWEANSFRTAHTESILRDIVDSSLPTWLRDDLWTTLQTNLRPEAATCEKVLRSGILKKKPDKPATSVQDLLYIHHAPINSLLATSQFIALYSTNDNKKDLAPIIPILQFLESNLPAGLTFIQWHQMIRIAPRLPDDTAAFDFARRHVMSKQDKNLHFMTTDWHIFLYWLRGLTTATHPDDAELLAEVDRCLVEIRSFSEK